MKKAEEKNKRKKFIGFWHYGVILTYLSVAAGVVGMCLSAIKGPFWGAVCLLISGLCDAFDGMVAGTRKNRTEEDRRFGEQIDSLSDMVVFGVEPLFIGFYLGMKAWYFYPVFCAFTLCALVRLAYYNVTQETIAAEGRKRTSFEGLPVTNVAIVIPVVYLVATMFREQMAVWIIMAAGYLVCALLFVLRFRMPKAGPRGLAIAIFVTTVLIISLCLIRTYVCGVPLLS